MFIGVAVRQIFNLFDRSKTGVWSVLDFRAMSEQLGEPHSLKTTKLLMEKMSGSAAGKNSIDFEDFYHWWTGAEDEEEEKEQGQTRENEEGKFLPSLDFGEEVKGVELLRPSRLTATPSLLSWLETLNTEEHGSMLKRLRHKLRSGTYLQTFFRYKDRMNSIKAPEDDNLFRFAVRACTGEFEESHCAATVRYCNDATVAQALRKSVQASPTAALLSVSLSIQPGVDEFELGELAGTISDVLLLGKQKFKFHSQKVQLVKERGEKVVRFSITYDNIPALEQVRQVVMAFAMQELNLRVELSQAPGEDTEEFIKAKIRGHLVQSANLVPFLVDLFASNKSATTRHRLNLLSTFRNLELDITADTLEEGYAKFSQRIPEIRDIRGFRQLKTKMLPLAVELYNDTSIPTHFKDTYFNATRYFRGLHSLHFQLGNEMLTIEAEELDLVHVLPVKPDIINYTPPQNSSASSTSSSSRSHTASTSSSTPSRLRPLFATNEFKIAVLGTNGVGKSATCTQFVQNMFVEAYGPTIEDAYRKHHHVDDELCTLEILDLSCGEAGLPFNDPLKARQILEGEGVILMYSITDRPSFLKVIELHEALLKLKDQKHIPMVLVGNKVDIVEHRQVGRAEGEDLAEEWDVPFFEESAKSGENVPLVFEQLVRECLRAREDTVSADWDELIVSTTEASSPV
ncbi:Ras- protein Rap-1A [Balamuthia mandrillaris]